MQKWNSPAIRIPGRHALKLISLPFWLCDSLFNVNLIETSLFRAQIPSLNFGKIQVAKEAGDAQANPICSVSKSLIRARSRQAHGLIWPAIF